MRLPALVVTLLAVFVVAYASLFTVHQTEQAIVLQLGEPKHVIKDPGLNVKMPFVQNVIYYDSRLLDLDPPIQQVILSDQKRLDVDSYSRYIISDPLKFYQAVRTEFNAREQLSRIINSRLRSVLGNVTLAQVLSDERTQIMYNIQRQVNDEAKAFGVDIIDVRIRRADLPEQTSTSIYNRMISEREREARGCRAQGNEQYQQITSRADREKTVLLAEAEREAQTMRGQGDADAYRIYAAAFGKDPDFFNFYRTLEAYRLSLMDNDTTMVITPQGDFFRYFESINGK